MATWSRHGKRASLALLMVALVAGSGVALLVPVGPTVPASAAASGSLDSSSVTLPAFRSGDVARYKVESDASSLIVDLTVDGPEAFLLPSGEWRKAWKVSWVHEGSVAAVTFVDGAGTVLGTRSGHGESSATITYLLPTEEDRGVEVSSHITVFGKDLRPCGVSGIVLGGSRAPGAVAAGGLRMEFAGARLPGNCPEGPATGRHEAASGLVVFSVAGADVVAYRADSPFPAWIKDAHGRTWTLESLGAGAGGTPDVSLPPPVAVAPARLSVADAMGPDETGSKVTPTFQSLFDAARDDVVNDRLRNYLKDNPQWYLSALAAQSSTDANGTRVTYRAFLNAPEAGFALELRGPRDNVMSPAASALEKVFGWDMARTEPLPMVDVPSRLPTLSSVQGIWSSLGGRPTHWGYETTCAWACLDQPFVWAGDAPLTAGEAGTFEGPPQRQGGLVLVGADGDYEARIDVVEERYALDSSRLGDVGAPPPWSFDLRMLSLGAAPWSEAGASLTIATLLAGLLWKAWPSLKAVFAAGFFSRVQDDKLLDHPTRRAISEAVHAEPGIHHKAIARRVAAGNGAVEHHLRKLVQASLLRRIDGGGYACYFPAGAPASRGAGVLKAEGARKVLRSVAKAPNANATAIAGMARLDAKTVSHHVQRLEEAGLVRTLRAGREVRVSLTELGTRAAAQV